MKIKKKHLNSKNNMKARYYFFVVFTFLFMSCNTDQEVVNIYSGRHYQADDQLMAEFTRQTGIRVNQIKADTDQLISRIELEGEKAPADLLITADVGRLIQAGKDGLMQPIESEKLTNIVPSPYRSADGYWTGLTKRARVIVYHKDRVDPSELSTYEALTDSKWNGRILVRTSQNHYNQTLMASIIAAHGVDEAARWAEGIVRNMARRPQGNDRDQVKALAAGVGDVAIVNTYYLGLLLNSGNPNEREVANQVDIFFPNQDDRGTHINISGIGLLAHAPNKENAVKLIEFLLSDEPQRILSENNYEYPISNRVEWPKLLEDWGKFQGDTIALEEVGYHLQEAMYVFNQEGWQ
jgi:iron(III) transport system substrate-binding protein